jgi:hypothetical protein
MGIFGKRQAGIAQRGRQAGSTFASTGWVLKKTQRTQQNASIREFEDRRTDAVKK